MNPKLNELFITHAAYATAELRKLALLLVAGFRALMTDPALERSAP